MHITKVTPADWETYKMLRMEALRAHPMAFAVTVEEAEARDETKWQELLQQPHICTLMAMVDGSPVGMVRAQWRPRNQKLRHIADIGSLYISTSETGKGLGKKLLLELENVLKNEYGITKMKLYVLVKNPARKLYESLDYRKVGLVEGEILHEGEYFDEFIYEKWIA